MFFQPDENCCFRTRGPTVTCAFRSAGDAEDVAEIAAMEQEVLAGQMPSPEMATGSPGGPRPRVGYHIMRPIVVRAGT